MGIRCYHCKSSETKTVHAAIEQLKINTSSKTIGGGIFGGGGGGMKAGVGVAKTEGGSSPELIKKLEDRIPINPSQPGYFSLPLLPWWFFILGPIIGLISNGGGNSSGVFFSALFIPGLIWHYKRRKRSYEKNYADYKEKYSKFKKLWYCFSCGEFSIKKDS
ncbi:hypothetical protein N8269_02045 [Candidatus Thioglobus sp.]|nr:hypothetical protein [Candidatus Thioglobus sp.]